MPRRRLKFCRVISCDSTRRNSERKGAEAEGGEGAGGQEAAAHRVLHAQRHRKGCLLRRRSLIAIPSRRHKLTLLERLRWPHYSHTPTSGLTPLLLSSTMMTRTMHLSRSVRAWMRRLRSYLSVFLHRHPPLELFTVVHVHLHLYVLVGFRFHFFHSR